MKLIIVLVIFFSVASSLRMTSFLSMEAEEQSFCSKYESKDMCSCQKYGCAFKKGSETCSDIGAETGSTVFSAGILNKCSFATTKDSCLTHVAWANRYGEKVECAWCSTVCTDKAQADSSCKESGILEGFYSTWTEPEPDYKVIEEPT